MHPHPKLRGEAAEAAFLHRAIQRGLIVACPWGDCAPFDLIVLGGRKLSRIQVKSATRIGAGTTGYVIVAQHNRHSRRRPYSSREIDFLVAYVEPEDAFYIFPPRVFRNRKKIKLFPAHRKDKRRYRAYRERWDLLFHAPSAARISLHACADSDFVIPSAARDLQLACAIPAALGCESHVGPAALGCAWPMRPSRPRLGFVIPSEKVSHPLAGAPSFGVRLR